MSIASVWSPDWRTGGGSPAETGEALLEVVPRMAVEARGVVWADLRGMPQGTPRRVLERARAAGTPDPRVGVGRVGVVAELAARTTSPEAPLRTVPAGEERAFLAPLPLALLELDPDLLALLEGVGISGCGQLAALDREAVEVRFGGAGVRAWRFCRGDDRRHRFSPLPPEPPAASLDFVDHAVRESIRLVFTAHALVSTLCAELARRGSPAAELLLDLSLEGGGTHRERIRSARPSVSTEAWSRRLRDRLDRLTLPDAVVGVALSAGRLAPDLPVQGDLFDRGFATAPAVEAALARLVDEQGEVLVTPERNAHPLPERRTAWQPRTPAEAVRETGAPLEDPPGDPAGEPRLLLQRLPRPHPLRLEADPGGRPHRWYAEEGWRRLVTVAGPDLRSGGWWEGAWWAREYYRCLSEEGSLLSIFRDARRDRWYLHGWWG